MLRMILYFTSDCRFYLQVFCLFVCLNLFISDEKFCFLFEIGVPSGRTLILPLVLRPYWRDRTAGSQAMWPVLFLFLFSLLYLLIDFIVLLFGMDLEVKGEETD